jgi:carbamoyltransferase
MSLNIIGISAFSHDSACCLLRDGHLQCAIEEERLSRLKHDNRLPWRGFRYCLDHENLSITDIDCIAFYENPQKKTARQIWMMLHPDTNISMKASWFNAIQPRRAETEIRERLGYDGHMEFVDHHISHAASSYYYSGFEEAAIMTVDAVGEWTTTSYGRAGGMNIELFKEVSFPHSLGMFYSAITTYLGFKANSDEYKVMGLAPYGKPQYVEHLKRILKMRGEGDYELDMKYFDYIRQNRMFSDSLVELLGKPPRIAESDILPFHQDVARSVQVVLEEILLENVRWLHQEVPLPFLCMAGGVALNCVANSSLLRNGPFSKLFVQPAATDSGGAMGAAAVVHSRLTGRRPGQGRLHHVYLGPDYSNETGRLIESISLSSFRYYEEETLLDAVVDRLCHGQVIGWFHGPLEFGPRALGSRSILADPRDPNMRDRINSLVKKRESFRPFAPAVLEHKAQEHFEIDHSSPFMIETCQVISKLNLPAITHVDGSARVQTVERDTNPRFFRLLEKFDERTGCPILLNTSFNMRGEPIVCTPVDAIRCFVRCGIDTLVLNNSILDCKDIPLNWKLSILTGNENNTTSAIRHDVYTLF